MHTGSYCEIDSGPVYSEVLTVSNGYLSGNWDDYDSCPTGSLAKGFQLKTQSYQGSFVDDSAVTVVKFFCRNPQDPYTDVAEIYSINANTGSYGSFEAEVFCDVEQWIVGFRLKVQPWVNGDNSAVNNLEVYCRELATGSLTIRAGQGISLSGASWGGWSSTCPDGTAVCAQQTRYDRNWSDNKGVTDLNMKCCEH